MNSDHTCIEYWLTGEGAQRPEEHLGAALDVKARMPGRGWRLVWGRARIRTGIALRIPQDMVVRLTGRSGNFMRGITVHDGLIESEFNGHELCALIHCPWPRVIRHGERIAQMWALPASRGAFQPLPQAPEDVTSLKTGFGSTGR